MWLVGVVVGQGAGGAAQSAATKLDLQAILGLRVLVRDQVLEVTERWASSMEIGFNHGSEGSEGLGVLGSEVGGSWGSGGFGGPRGSDGLRV